jgi:Tfp pilus assembly protein PilE
MTTAEYVRSSEAGFSLIEAIVSTALIAVAFWVSSIAFEAYSQVILPSPARNAALEAAQNTLAQVQAVNAYYTQNAYQATALQSTGGAPVDWPFPPTASYNVDSIVASLGGVKQTIPLTVFAQFARGPNGTGTVTIDMAYPGMPQPPTGQVSDVHLQGEISAPAYSPGTSIHYQIGEPERM